MSNIFLPPIDFFSTDDVFKWYCNFLKEIEILPLSESEIDYIDTNPYDSAVLKYYKYLDHDVENIGISEYFRLHFSDTFFQSLDFFIEDGHNNTILDLGCGLGSQSIFFALQGMHVIAIDIDKIALGIFRKRIILYENLLGFKLNIDIIEKNAFDFPLKSIDQIDAIYSMFAFNIMQPSSVLLDRLLEHTLDNCKICILDGNNSLLINFLTYFKRSDAWSPVQFEKELIKRGFVINSHYSGIAIPLRFWRGVKINFFLKILNSAFKKTWYLSLSHQILATKNK
jgi:SAM-dependent methyltransferase